MNQEIGVQTGGIFMWSVTKVTASDPRLRSSWDIETAGTIIRGMFQGREDDDIYVGIKPFYIIPTTVAGTR